jgi:tripartite-type tricarboxylate transporter receptor subunit TctC
MAVIKAGKVRALAVTIAKRSPVLPDVPTVAETVPGLEADTWQGIAAPKGTPDEIVAKLNKGVNAALADPGVKAQMAALGSTPMPMSPQQFKDYVVADIAKWAEVIRDAHITPEN